MRSTPTPPLRLGLHLLLAACLVVQATVALALGTAMLADASHQAAANVGGATGARYAGLPDGPLRASKACHPAPAAAPAVAPEPPDDGRCDMQAGLCEWVCTSAPALAAARPMVEPAERPDAPPVAKAGAALRWPAGTPLRPPIA